MKLKIFFTVPLLLLADLVFSQAYYCADSSIRIKYVFENNGAALFNNPDTSGYNIFTGELSSTNLATGIALLKTTWGDSMIWAKKILMNGTSRNSFRLADGSILCTGYFGVAASSELLLCRLTATGNVIWVKHYKLAQNHLNYQNVSYNAIKNIFVTNNAIYFDAIFNFLPIQAYNYFNVIAKLDLNGNILWSNGFRVALPRIASIFDAPVLYKDTLIFPTNTVKQLASGNFEGSITLTKLKDTDGSIIESTEYKLIPDATVEYFGGRSMNINTDNSLSLSGFCSLKNILSNLGTPIFNTSIDTNSIPFNSNYYTNKIPLDEQELYFAFNNQKQHAFLSNNIFNSKEKYFASFGKNNEIIRSRKLIIPPGAVSIYRTSLNLDNKQNLHFIYHYPQNGKQVTEYARISNFSPNSTVGCLGKDTSILTQYPFNITKQPFTWDIIQSDVIVSSNVPYTEDTAIVTKELICKIVSYCDSLKIAGPPTACVNQPVRYTVTRNNICQKFNDWAIDTAFANIVNTEGDSAITLSFKKPFTGYLHASLSDCVVKDSIFIKAVQPVKKTLLPRQDSVLCPGKTLTLNAGNGFTNYTWLGNGTGQNINIRSAGQYIVTALDSCNNLVKDSITVTASDTSLTLPANQIICKYDTAFIILPQDVTNITWQPTAASTLRNKTIVAYPLQTTLYSVTAQRQANCPINRISIVTVNQCPRNVYIPNSFTPDGNGRNDIFKPSISQTLAAYHFTIYNRYGQIVFETTNQTSGWDGTYKNTAQPMGGYMYYCTYRFNGGIQNTEKGYLMLLR